LLQSTSIVHRSILQICQPSDNSMKSYAFS
jgi:hypothetical protein